MYMQRERLRAMACGAIDGPQYRGGSHSSSSSSYTTNNYDQRQVNDQSQNRGIIGTGNTINNITTDGGAFQFADSLAGHALDDNLRTTQTALDTVRLTTGDSIAAIRENSADSLHFADSITHLLGQTTSAAITATNAAYTDAKGEGNTAKTIALAAGAVALIAVVAMARKG